MISLHNIEGELYHPKQAKESFLNSLALLNEVLLLTETKEIVVSCHGSGDSGTIEEPEMPDDFPKELPSCFTYVSTSYVIDWQNQEDKIYRVAFYEGISVMQMVVMFADDLIDGSGVNYGDNEGGQGTLTITATPEGLDFNLEMGSNYDEPVTTSYSEEDVLEQLGETL